MSILTHRLRRMRKHEFNRSLIRENSLSASDLIYPLFIVEGENKRVEIDSMPGIERLSIDQLLVEVKEIVDLKIQAIALFPVISSERKTEDAEEKKRVRKAISKSIPKRDPKRVPTRGLQTNPRELQDASKSTPRGLQERPTGPSKPPLSRPRLQDASKRLPRAIQSAPGSLQERSKAPHRLLEGSP